MQQDHTTIKPLRGAANEQQHSVIQGVIDGKTKPPGSLGQLESLAMQLALSLGDNPEIRQPTMLIFAGDHGVADAGVSIAPSAVTTQMVLNFLHGGAAINVFCRQAQMALKVIDCGILTELPPQPGLLHQRLGATTAPLQQQMAMSLEMVDRGFSLAADLVDSEVIHGVNLFGIGEMGIGNTTSAAAVMAALTGLDVGACVGRGTGIDDQQFALKKAIVSQALTLHEDKLTDPRSILACVGGFEIVQMTGAILAIAAQGKLVLIDGFIATVAALAAVRIAPHCRDYLIFAHSSHEQGHQLLLQSLDATPLLNLDLRLGEGSGAALALPLVRSAAAFYNEMASFEQAGVDKV